MMYIERKGYYVSPILCIYNAHRKSQFPLVGTGAYSPLKRVEGTPAYLGEVLPDLTISIIQTQHV